MSPRNRLEVLVCIACAIVIVLIVGWPTPPIKETDMLILTRRVGEVLRIGDEVQVTVLGVKGNQVRIGIIAPKHIAVHREEIYQQIKRQQGNGGAR